MAIVWEKDVEKCEGLGGFDEGRKGRRFWRKGLGYYVLLFLVRSRRRCPSMLSFASPYYNANAARRYSFLMLSGSRLGADSSL
jgi:hypothetical protein